MYKYIYYIYSDTSLTASLLSGDKSPYESWLSIIPFLPYDNDGYKNCDYDDNDGYDDDCGYDDGYDNVMMVMIMMIITMVMIIMVMIIMIRQC
jgi:hypothetical protein